MLTFKYLNPQNIWKTSRCSINNIVPIGYPRAYRRKGLSDTLRSVFLYTKPQTFTYQQSNTEYKSMTVWVNLHIQNKILWNASNNSSFPFGGIIWVRGLKLSMTQSSKNIKEWFVGSVLLVRRFARDLLWNPSIKV